jgi:hypothetical protein
LQSRTAVHVRELMCKNESNVPAGTFAPDVHGSETVNRQVTGLELKKCSCRNILARWHRRGHTSLTDGPLGMRQGREWTKCSCRNIVENSIAPRSGFGFAELLSAMLVARSHLDLRTRGAMVINDPKSTSNRGCAPTLNHLGYGYPAWHCIRLPWPWHFDLALLPESIPQRNTGPDSHFLR